jgi:hypothetical protein
MGIGAAEASAIRFIQGVGKCTVFADRQRRGIWHRGIRCMQRLDLRLNLPLEAAPPLGKLGLSEDFQPAFPVE